MPAVGLNGDTVGGAPVSGTTLRTLIHGKKPVRFGDVVPSHGTGPHASATMNQASNTLRFEGVRVCRIGDSATCGHVLVDAGGLHNVISNS